jgi:hypothetical protein
MLRLSLANIKSISSSSSLSILPTTQVRFMTMKDRKAARFFAQKEQESRRAHNLFPQEKRKVNNQFLKQVLTSYKQHRRWKPAYQMFQGLVQQRVQPNLEVYRLFLYVVGYRGGEVQKAFNIFRYCGRIMKDTGAYNIMIHTVAHHDFKMNDDIEDYLPSSSFKKAFDLYEEMKANKIQPDHFTFRYLLKVCSSELKKNQSRSTTEQSDENQIVVSNDQVTTSANYVVDELMKYNFRFIENDKLQPLLAELQISKEQYFDKYRNLIEEQNRYEEEFKLSRQVKDIKKKIAHELITPDDAETTAVFQQWKQQQQQNSV